METFTPRATVNAAVLSHRFVRKMEIVTCKNCEMSVVASESRICPSCGHDVTLRSPNVPSHDDRMLKHRQDLRNWVWAIAFIAFLPTFVFLFSYFSDPIHVQISAISIAILSYSILLSLLALVSGFLIGCGRMLGVKLAYIPALLLLVNFPLGTIFSVLLLRKLNSATLIAALK